MEPERLNDAKTGRWAKNLSGALAALLLLPIPAYGGYIAFGTWSPLTSGNGTTATISTLGSPNTANNVLSFFPQDGPNFSDTFTLQTTISGFVNSSTGNGLSANLNTAAGSNLTAGTLNITVSVGSTATTPNITVTPGGGSNQFSTSTSNGLFVGESVSVTFQLTNSTTSSSASTPYTLSFLAN